MASNKSMFGAFRFGPGGEQMAKTKVVSGKASNMGRFGKPDGKSKVTVMKKGYKK